MARKRVKKTESHAQVESTEAATVAEAEPVSVPEDAHLATAAPTPAPETDVTPQQADSEKLKAVSVVDEKIADVKEEKLVVAADPIDLPSTQPQLETAIEAPKVELGVEDKDGEVKEEKVVVKGGKNQKNNKKSQKNEKKNQATVDEPKDKAAEAAVIPAEAAEVETASVQPAETAVKPVDLSSTQPQLETVTEAPKVELGVEDKDVEVKEDKEVVKGGKNQKNNKKSQKPEKKKQATVDEPKVKAADSAVARTEAAVAEPAETVVKPVETAVAKPTETAVVKPAETDVVKPAETAVVRPAETAVVKPAETAVVKPAETSVTKPMETSVVEPKETAVTDVETGKAPTVEQEVKPIEKDTKADEGQRIALTAVPLFVANEILKEQVVVPHQEEEEFVEVKRKDKKKKNNQKQEAKKPQEKSNTVSKKSEAVPKEEKTAQAVIEVPEEIKAVETKDAEKVEQNNEDAKKQTAFATPVETVASESAVEAVKVEDKPKEEVVAKVVTQEEPKNIAVTEEPVPEKPEVAAEVKQQPTKTENVEQKSAKNENKNRQKNQNKKQSANNEKPQARPTEAKTEEDVKKASPQPETKETEVKEEQKEIEVKEVENKEIKKESPQPEVKATVVEEKKESEPKEGGNKKKQKKPSSKTGQETKKNQEKPEAKSKLEPVAENDKIEAIVEKKSVKAKTISIGEDDDGVFEVRPVFLPNTCHVCKAVHNEKVTLKSCASCRMIAYCSADHQKEHWPEHKQVCKFVKQELLKQKRKHIFETAKNAEYGTWKRVRYATMMQCEDYIKRPLQPYEREMFLYPRHCDTCYETDGEKLHQCKVCFSSFFCSAQHKKKEHDRWCGDLKLLFDLTVEQAKSGRIEPPFPDKVFQQYEVLPSSMKEFLVTRMMGPGGIMAFGNNSFSCLTEAASYPLTLLYALQRLEESKSDLEKAVAEERGKSLFTIKPIDELKSMVIHVVGAELAFECDSIIKWDIFFVHLLPNLQSLRIVFIGPELTSGSGIIPNGICDEDLRCPHCINAERKIDYDFQPGLLYQDYVKSKQYVKPNVIVAYNCGLYRETGYSGVDTWGPSIKAMTADHSIPVVLTAYTSAEAPKDTARVLRTVASEVLVIPQKNPFRSLKPCRNFVDEESAPVMYKNNFFSVVHGV